MIQKQASPPVSTPPTAFQCPRCPKAYPFADSLRKHSRREHGAPLFTCSMCFKAYVTKEEKVRHKQTKEHRINRGVDEEDSFNNVETEPELEQEPGVEMEQPEVEQEQEPDEAEVEAEPEEDFAAEQEVAVVVEPEPERSPAKFHGFEGVEREERYIESIKGFRRSLLQGNLEALDL